MTDATHRPTASLYMVDAFTDEPFSGNPAGVCLLDRPADPAWMAAVAREVRASETAFVRPIGAGYELRWFSVSGEVDICGHATIAATHVLDVRGLLASGGSATFETRSGTMVAHLRESVIELDFPADPVSEADLPGLADALAGTPTFLGRGRFYWLAAFRDEAEIRALRPDAARLATIVPDGIVCTARSDRPDADVFSRFFAPSLGNPEDVVTGSSACELAPYWAPILGRPAFRARQEHLPTGRGGIIEITDRGQRVGIGGRAVIVARGELVA
jgi:PhzF family phenazine biosynthesis protein